MSININEKHLRLERADAWTQMESLTEKARWENRDLTEDEQAAFDEAERILTMCSLELGIDDREWRS